MLKKKSNVNGSKIFIVALLIKIQLQSLHFTFFVFFFSIDDVRKTMIQQVNMPIGVAVKQHGNVAPPAVNGPAPASLSGTNLTPGPSTGTTSTEQGRCLL